MRRLAIAALIALTCGAGIRADQAFEVVSVKANPRCGGPGRGSGGVASPGRMVLACAQLRDLILTAYGIYADGDSPGPRSFRMQVLGGPGWVDSDGYDIVAKAEGNPPRSQLYGPMLRALLEDRFKLRVHRETREAPVYFLTVAKGGAKLHVAKSGSHVTSPEGTVDLYGATMASLSTQLGIRLDRDVIDKTGIAGMFDIHLEVSRADLAPRALAGAVQTDPSTPALGSDSSGPSIFTALQQQLGLKLEPGKGPVEFLVIDQIEKPSEN